MKINKIVPLPNCLGERIFGVCDKCGEEVVIDVIATGIRFSTGIAVRTKSDGLVMDRASKMLDAGAKGLDFSIPKAKV